MSASPPSTAIPRPAWPVNCAGIIVVLTAEVVKVGRSVRMETGTSERVTRSLEEWLAETQASPQRAETVVVTLWLEVYFSFSGLYHGRLRSHTQELLAQTRLRTEWQELRTAWWCFLFRRREARNWGSEQECWCKVVGVGWINEGLICQCQRRRW